MGVRKSKKINGIGARGLGVCSLRCLVAPRGLTAAAYGCLGAWQEQLAGPLQLARTAGSFSASWSPGLTAKLFIEYIYIYIYLFFPTFSEIGSQILNSLPAPLT